MGIFRLNRNRCGGEERAMIAIFKYLKNCPKRTKHVCCGFRAQREDARINGVKNKGANTWAQNDKEMSSSHKC